MATLASLLAPTENERTRNRRRVYYPVARVDIQAVFEDYIPDTDRVPKTFRAIPTSATVIRNGYSQADTWQIDFNLKDFPITPESVRAGAVELRLFHTNGSIEEAANTTVLEGSTLGVPPTIVGLFDDVTVSLSESGGTVSISGTDYTALFIGSKWPQDRRIPAGSRLDDTIKDLMQEIGGVDNLRVVVEPAEEASELPTVGKSEGRTNKKQVKVQADNYWDAMYSLVVRHGYILFVRGLEVVIARPKTYIEGRTSVKKLSWGDNLTNLTISRKLGKRRSPTIEVRSYDDSTQTTLKAKYPPNNNYKKVTVGKNNGKVKASEEIEVVVLEGIKDIKTLERVAETKFNLTSRGEQEINITTNDLEDLEGNNLLELSAGDAVKVSFNPTSEDLLEVQAPAQRIETLKKLGYSEEAARQLSESVEKSSFFRKPFRVREVTISWDIEAGMSISATIQNFVIIDLSERAA